jgi:hypothetical protein
MICLGTALSADEALALVERLVQKPGILQVQQRGKSYLRLVVQLEKRERLCSPTYPDYHGLAADSYWPAINIVARKAGDKTMLLLRIVGDPLNAAIERVIFPLFAISVGIASGPNPYVLILAILLAVFSLLKYQARLTNTQGALIMNGQLEQLVRVLVESQHFEMQ